MGVHIIATLFGFEFKRKTEPQEQERERTFALPQNDDGALTIQTGSYYGTYVDLDGVVRNEVELITKYRDMSGQPELESAISDIVGEAIITDENGKSIDINLDNLKQPESIKKKIRDEFKYILKLLNYSNNSHDLFRRWYVDGRMFYHIVVDEKAPSAGIKELRFVDPRRIRKVREVQKGKDPQTGVEIVKQVNEYYVYNDRGLMATTTHMGQKVSADAIINVNSGLMDSKQTMVLSYLHKAIRPLNQLRMVEDATVIYRLSRAPERRIFYVDVGNMPPIKAEQYLKDTMTKYRNKIVYDANTGEIKDQKRYMAMLEDFWLARREGNRSTEITTLQGGQNLGKIEDVEYFQKKLYTALDIPFSRASSQVGPSSGNGGSKIVGLGRPAEIDRDELKFNKFIKRLRNKFAILFDEALKAQLMLKQVCTEEDWEDWQEEIYYDFLKDIHQEELKEQELWASRLSMVAQAMPYAGQLVSIQWIKKTLMHLTDDEIKQMQKEIDDEAELMAKIQAQNAPTDADGNPIPVGPDGAPLPQQPPQPLQPVAPLDSDSIDQSKEAKYAAMNDDVKAKASPPKKAK